ncbi:MAG: phosphate ABC transporter permease subunit PstC [Planctomycetota bacterium]|nr:phosphate ABC transporter permease subunit PstC [Planctomycetota bacterium]
MPQSAVTQRREDAAHALDSRDASFWWDLIARILVFTGGFSVILFITSIFIFIAMQGMGFAVNPSNWEQFLTSAAWRPSYEEAPQYGALYLILGTASITLCAMALAVPLSIGSAIYISEFAQGRSKEWLKVIIELLAAIPSVVWGMIGMLVFAPIITWLFDIEFGLTLLNAGIVLGLMAAPIMTTLAEDALKAVPESYREAAEALGATRWQVVWRVVMPHARPGLSGAVLLGVGRAVGETMAVLMVAGGSIRLPTSPLEPVSALTATIASEMPETAKGDEHYQALFTLGILLFMITFVINFLADRIIRGRRSKR